MKNAGYIPGLATGLVEFYHKGGIVFFKKENVKQTDKSSRRVTIG